MKRTRPFVVRPLLTCREAACGVFPPKCVFLACRWVITFSALPGDPRVLGHCLAIMARTERRSRLKLLVSCVNLDNLRMSPLSARLGSPRESVRRKHTHTRFAVGLWFEPRPGWSVELMALDWAHFCRINSSTLDCLRNLAWRAMNEHAINFPP